MKHKLLLAILFFLSAYVTQAQNKYIQQVPYKGAFAPAPASPWTTGWTNFDPQNAVYPAANVLIDATAGDTIKVNTTWTSNNVYLLKGTIYVKDGAILTIEAGTVIRGSELVANSSLIVTRGSQVVANGTASRPIVFTSNKAVGQRARGNWGGIILLGKATNNISATAGGTTGTGTAGLMQIEGLPTTPINRHGAGDLIAPVADDNDNSGVLRFVRIEYTGFVFSANNEINALTMGSVGRGTVIDYVQVSNGDDDSFEWFGGTVNCSHMVSFQARDDDFDADYGYSGSNQFGLTVRDPALSDASRTSGFEIDNEASGNTRNPAFTPPTNPTFSNFTQIGPWRDNAVSGAIAIDPNHRSAAHLRRNNQADISNTVFIGWNSGLWLGDSVTYERNFEGNLKLNKNVLAGTNYQPLSGSSVDYKAISNAPRNAYDSTGFKGANTGNGFRWAGAFGTNGVKGSDSTWFGLNIKNDTVNSRYGLLVNATTATFTAADYRPLSSTPTVLLNPDYSTASLEAARVCVGNTPTVGAISGSSTVPAAGSASLTYSVASVGAGTYQWAVPKGFTITAGQGTTSITVTAIAGATGLVTVVPGTFCEAASAFSYGNISSFNVVSGNLNPPAAPSTLLLNYANVCHIIVPNVGALAGATVARVTSTTPANTASFVWTLPIGVVPIANESIVGGGTIETVTPYLDVKFLSTVVVNSLISVNSKSASGVTSLAAKTVKVPFKVPGAPVIKSWNGSADVTAIINACPLYTDVNDLESDIVQYTIRQDSVATGYTWSVSNAATMILVGSPNDTIVSVRFTNAFTFGVLTITKTSGCGSYSKTLTIKKLAAAKPGALRTFRNGTTPAPYVNVCDVVGSVTEFVRYQLPSVPAYSSSYIWSVLNGGPAGSMTIVGGGGALDNFVDVRYGAGFTFGSVRVQSVNSCSVSFATILTVKATIPVFPPLTVISGATTTGLLCGATNVILTTSAVATDSTTNDYLWTLPTGVTPNASITTTFVGAVAGGNNYSTASNSIAIDWNSTKAGKIVVAGRSFCGVGKAISLTLVATPAKPAIPTEVQSCPGQFNYTYSVPAIPGAVSYTWKVPVGVVINSGQTTNSITVTYPGTPVNGSVSVSATNSCGTSLSSAIVKTAFTPIACLSRRPGSIISEDGTETSVIGAKVIPNPNNGSFVLRIQTTNVKDAAQIQVLDIQGRVVLNLVGVNNNGLIQSSINNNTLLPNGSYLVKYTVGTETGTVKMVIQK